MLYFLIFCPVASAVILLFVRKRILQETITFIVSISELAAGVFVAAETLSRPSSLGSYFGLDALAGVFLLITVIVAFFASIYSIGYLRSESSKRVIGNRRVKQFFVLLQLFVATMVMAISTTNPIVMWIAVEATTLATVFLVSFYNKPASTEAAWKYLIVNSIGLLLGFLGILLYFTASGGENSGLTTWQSLAAAASHLNPLIAKLAFVFIFIGFGTKVGLAPMHTWLPDAHSKAPSPISALLSGALLNVAMLAILRFKLLTDAAAGIAFSRGIMIFFGIVSLLVAAFIILSQNNYKRLMAYSSVEHMGLAALGFGFGGIGIFYTLLHLIFHSLTKSLLFLVSGNIFLKYSTTKIAKVRGALSALPWSTPVLFLGFLAITGVPPFGIFITEFKILSAGIAPHPIYVIIALACLALIFVGFLRHIARMTFGEKPVEIETGEANLWTVIPPVILTALIIVLSFYLPSSLRTLLTSAAGIIK